MSAEAVSSPVYSAPAVEKALDVLEFLAGSSAPVTQNQIAQHTGRSVNQIYRVLSVLEKRGYIARDTTTGRYCLTLRLYDVAHRQEPVRGLVWLADAPMRALAAEVGQSCNLAWRDGGSVVVVAEAVGPSDFGFSIRVGSRWPLEGTPSGELFLALDDAAPRPVGGAAAGDDLAARLAGIRGRGYNETVDQVHPGVTDMSFPVRGRDGHLVAALTVPYIATSYSSPHRADSVRAATAATAARIGELLAGDAAPPDAPTSPTPTAPPLATPPLATQSLATEDRP